VASEQVETASPAPLGRDEILAQLDAQPSDDAPVETVEAAVEDEEAEPVEAEADGESVEEDEADEDSDEEDAPAEDPKTQKGLDAVRRAEKRHREQMASDRAEFAREQSKHAERIAKLDEYEDAAKRVKYDPGSLLKKLGVAEDDYELIAHAIYAESKAGAADPARKAAAAARLRDREKEDKLTATEKRMADLEAKIEADKVARADQAEAERYIGEVNATAKTKFPLIAHMMANAPDDVGDGLSAAFDRLKAKTGKPPAPAQVVAEMDRKERARLKAIGVDPDAIVKAKPITAAKPAAKVNGIAKPANVNAPKSRDEILAELESLA